ncbi:unnamed protein product, partial [Polarella glacialis]
MQELLHRASGSLQPWLLEEPLRKDSSSWQTHWRTSSPRRHLGKDTNPTGCLYGSGSEVRIGNRNEPEVLLSLLLVGLLLLLLVLLLLLSLSSLSLLVVVVV